MVGAFIKDIIFHGADFKDQRESKKLYTCYFFNFNVTTKTRKIVE